MGCTNPKHEKPMLRFRPLGTAFDMMATEVGKQNETATPCIARNMISSIPVRARPHPSTKQETKAQPITLIDRFPTTSATEPAKRRHEPHARLFLSLVRYPTSDTDNLRVYRSRPSRVSLELYNFQLDCHLPENQIIRESNVLCGAGQPDGQQP